MIESPTSLREVYPLAFKLYICIMRKTGEKKIVDCINIWVKNSNSTESK